MESLASSAFSSASVALVVVSELLVACSDTTVAVEFAASDDDGGTALCDNVVELVDNLVSTYDNGGRAQVLEDAATRRRLKDIAFRIEKDNEVRHTNVFCCCCLGPNACVSVT